VHDRPHGEGSDLVDEDASTGFRILFDDRIDDLAAESTDGVLVDRPLEVLAILDNDRVAGR